VDRLVELRGSLPSEGRPSLTAFVVKAVAHALRKHPYMNSGMEGDKILRYKAINIGVAVALEDGLIVVVIKDALKKSLGDIHREIEELARKAREGSLSVSDVEGSTFSVSNLGMFNVDSFTPIIYPGHAGVLGVGRIRDSVKPNQEGGFTVEKCLTLSLTFDHRIVDGAQAAVFLNTVREYLEDPLPYLLGVKQ